MNTFHPSEKQDSFATPQKRTHECSSTEDDSYEENVGKIFHPAAKHKHHKPGAHRAGDWICLICNNLNYSFRAVCNRCKMQTKRQNLIHNLMVLNVQGDGFPHFPQMNYSYPCYSPSIPQSHDGCPQENTFAFKNDTPKKQKSVPDQENKENFLNLTESPKKEIYSYDVLCKSQNKNDVFASSEDEIDEDEHCDNQLINDIQKNIECMLKEM